MKKQLVFLLCSVWATVAFAQPEIQYFRPWDQQGINVFEPAKNADQPAYDGFKIRIGGAFTQTFQSLSHENTDTSAAGVNALYPLGPGFNLAMANLNLDFQIEDGIRVCLENYMSSRHHSEFWVKGGYIQIDKLPMFENTSWFDDNFRVKIGHFQPNYGDMQFRRNDGGNAMYNPFVENYILDAFTTEIGGEVYVFPADGFMAMFGMTTGLIGGYVKEVNATNADKKPSITLKLAYDKQINSDLRLRLSGSMYNNGGINRSTLYGGDRTGSQYFLAMEGAEAAAGTNFTSGRLNPNFRNVVQSIMINPFIKFKGLEVFGAYEIAKGRTFAETDDRTFNQISGEVIYRFLANEQLYVGARYIKATGELQGFADEISIDRTAIAAGWFPTKNLLLKGEYVIQNYTDFPGTDIRHEGTFNGFVIQAVVGF
jgi:hypothetical protein